MKKIIGLILLSLSINVNAGNVEDSKEYKEHTKKIMSYTVNTVFNNEYISKFNYVGENWFLVKDNNGEKTYIQRDIETNVITRVRFIEKYNEIKLGKNIKYLEYRFGQSLETKGKFLFIEEGTSRVRIYSDFDLIGKNYNEMFSIIDFIDNNGDKKRKESLHSIYYEEEMIRR